MSFVGLGLVGAVLGPTLPALAELTRTSISQISILFVARSVGYLGGSILGGNLFDRIPGHPLMALTLIGLGISLLFTPQVSLLWILIGIIFITGLSQGVVDVGGNTFIVWLHGKNVWTVYECAAFILRSRYLSRTDNNRSGCFNYRRDYLGLLDHCCFFTLLGAAIVFYPQPTDTSH